MTYEEFKDQIQSIPDHELKDMASSSLRKLCETGGRSFTITVPPRLDDSDVVLAELIRRFEIVINKYTL